MLRTWRFISGPSDADPVMTTLILPPASSSECQSGRTLDDLVVEADADPPAHADDQALADLGRAPFLPVLHDVLSNFGDSLLSPNDRFDPSPSGLEALSGVRLRPAL